MKRFIAAALSLCILGGSLPAVQNYAPESCITANAISTGSAYYIGDTFPSKGYYFYDDCYDRVEYASKDLVLKDFEHHSVSIDYWNVGHIGTGYLYIQTPENRGYKEEPAGIKIVSGTGSESDPYHLRLVYSNSPAASRVIKVGDILKKGDTITSYDYFYIPTYFSIDEGGYLTSRARLGTTDDIVYELYKISDENISALK